ncbi:MAG: N-acetylmuramoyl-L-alanine amidase [Micromonosporaceae bacterium]
MSDDLYGPCCGDSGAELTPDLGEPEAGLSRRSVLRGGAVAGAVLLSTGGTLLNASPALAVDRPTIYTTGDWNAQPPKEPIDVINRRPTKLIIHHTASANSTDYSRAHAFQLARNIQQWHFNRGWRDSGQQFTISRGGHIMVGRHRSLPALIDGNKHVIGAHCTGQNEVAVGIENEGNYMNVQIRDEHYRKLVRMCAFICQKYGIPPRNIKGHRDFVATLCPGDRLYARLPRLRDDVRALLNA